MRLEFSGKSDIGIKRQINQDAFCAYQQEDAGLFAVADGMGGYTNGEKASQKVVAELSNWWNSFSPVLFQYEFRKMLLSIEQTIEYANRSIYRELNENEVCGTTVTVLFIYENFYGVIYAGDSRCYLCRGRKWEQLTVDEVWENQSDLSDEERRMKNHPDRGKLVNAVGAKENVRCRVITDVISADTKFLLCTDGLYKFCADRFLRNAVKRCRDKKSMEQAINELMDRVYKNGAGDNISILIVRHTVTMPDGCCSE